MWLEGEREGEEQAEHCGCSLLCERQLQNKVQHEMMMLLLLFDFFFFT